MQLAAALTCMSHASQVDFSAGRQLAAACMQQAAAWRVRGSCLATLLMQLKLVRSDINKLEGVMIKPAMSKPLSET